MVLRLWCLIRLLFSRLKRTYALMGLCDRWRLLGPCMVVVLVWRSIIVSYLRFILYILWARGLLFVYTFVMVIRRRVR